MANNSAAPVATKPGTAKPIIRYQDRRLVTMLFDFSTMDISEQIRVQKTAIDFIHQDLKPADLVCIILCGPAPAGWRSNRTLPTTKTLSKTW